MNVKDILYYRGKINIFSLLFLSINYWSTYFMITILPLFHDFTGCNTVSSFHGREKPCCISMSIDQAHVRRLMTVVNICSRRKIDKSITSRRQKQHLSTIFYARCIKKLSFGASFWGESTVVIQNLPSPSEWGWERNCLLYTSPSPRDRTRSRMPSSA